MRVQLDLEDLQLQAERTEDNDWLVEMSDKFTQEHHTCHLSDNQLAGLTLLYISNEPLMSLEDIKSEAWKLVKDWPAPFNFLP